ncbi:invasion associated locus B family protein [Roseomonas sp. CCTCC AB2023176]|uniref:invasion associated locus B family protein n=1 Tax=Roseomonas sp. CCTCC AB2023176 TaxID=3342640 RepID=UPI0035D5F235
MLRTLPGVLLGAALLCALPAHAQQQRPAASGPQRIGTFGAWTAATHQEGGGKVCYAFTRASRSEGGGQRQNVLMTVTHRPQGRDQVAVRVGHSFARNAELQVRIGERDFPFYTAGDTGFARGGAAVIAALRNGRDAVARGPGPGNRGGTTDTFSLNGFNAAYEAISRECPAGAPRR